MRRRAGGEMKFIEFSKYPCTRQCLTRRLHFSTVSIYLALFFIRTYFLVLATTPASLLNSTLFPAYVAVSLFLLERRFYSVIISDFSISQVPRRYFSKMRVQKIFGIRQFSRLKIIFKMTSFIVFYFFLKINILNFYNQIKN